MKNVLLLCAVALSAWTATSNRGWDPDPPEIYEWSDSEGNHRQEYTRDAYGEVVEFKQWLNGRLMRHCREIDGFKLRCEELSSIVPEVPPTIRM